MGGLTELLVIGVGIVAAVGFVLWLMHFASSRSTNGGSDVREPLRAAIKALIAAGDAPDEDIPLPAWVGHEVDEAAGETLAGVRSGRAISAALDVDGRGRATLQIWMATHAAGRFHLEIAGLEEGLVSRTVDKHDTDAIGRNAAQQIPEPWLSDLAAHWPTTDLRHQPGALSWTSDVLRASAHDGSHQQLMRSILDTLAKIAGRIEHDAPA